MSIEQLLLILGDNAGTLVFSVLGAFILTGLSIKEHLDRDEKNKMPKGQYSIYLASWVIGYPLLGFIVSGAYLANDNQFGAWMSLQIGLSSPAIVVGLATTGANRLSKKLIQTSEGQ